MGGNEHVVHVDDQPSFSQFLFEYGVHHHLEGHGGVGEAEEHNCRLEQSFVGDEGGLPFIALFDSHVIVTPLDVELSEEHARAYLVD